MNINGQEIVFGININDRTQGFTEQILELLKDIETRSTRDVFRALIGLRVALIRTGCGPATIVGLADIAGVKLYETSEEFHKDDARHLVQAGSKFDIKPGNRKYGYILENVERCDPIPAPAGTGNRSYRHI